MTSKDLNIHCTFCGELIARYHKKGSGALLRLYLDRISGPIRLLTKIKSEKKPSTLDCPKCFARLGSLSKKAKSPAYRLISGSFRKFEVKTK